MTVQQLKYILKVAEVGSITEAAKLLFISQPSLSNSIKETEKEAGITIKAHPLASKKVVSVHDLAPYPRLNFVQGEYESVYFSEKLFSSIPVDKEIRVNDRGAIVNFMLGLNAYTISSGIFPKYLNGENIISVPLAENETMHIGYVLNENQELSELGKSYLEELRKYAPANP